MSKFSGQILDMCNNEKKCNLLQAELSLANANEQAIQSYEAEIDGENVLEVINKTKYGRFVISKLFFKASNQYRHGFIHLLFGSKVDEWKDSMCYFLQEVVEMVNHEEAQLFTRRLIQDAERIACGKCSRFIIIKSMEKLAFPHLQKDLARSILSIGLKLSGNEYGNKVLLDAIDLCIKFPDLMEGLSFIHGHLFEISFDKYGNFVVQKWIARTGAINDENLNYNILHNEFQGKLQEMSHHKYASKVVEILMKESMKKNPMLMDAFFSEIFDIDNFAGFMAFFTNKTCMFVVANKMANLKKDKKETFSDHLGFATTRIDQACDLLSKEDQEWFSKKLEEREKWLEDECEKNE